MWERSSAISSREDKEALQHQSEGQRHHCRSVSHFCKSLPLETTVPIDQLHWSIVGFIWSRSYHWFMQRSAVRLSEWSVSFCFSSELVFDCAGFSLCSAGWQLFYAAIWVVGFLPAPGHVLDKVRQVSIETRPGGWSKIKKKTERKSLQTEIVSLKLMSSSSSLHAEPRWLAAAVLLWQLHVVPAVCAWLFCSFPFIPRSLQMHILHRMHRLSSVLCPSLVLDVMSPYISISVDFLCATKELQVTPVNVSPKCPSVNTLKKQFPS